MKLYQQQGTHQVKYGEFFFINNCFTTLGKIQLNVKVYFDSVEVLQSEPMLKSVTF
jgi:hypothetical protein